MSLVLNPYTISSNSNRLNSSKKVPSYLNKYQQIFKEMLENQGIGTNNQNKQQNFFIYQNTQPNFTRNNYKNFISNSFSSTPLNDEFNKAKFDIFLGENKYTFEPNLNYSASKKVRPLKNNNKKIKYNYGYSKNYPRYIKESAIHHFKDYVKDVKNKRPVTNFKQEMYNIKKEMLNKNNNNIFHKRKLFDKNSSISTSSNEFIEKLHKNFPEYTSMKKFSGNSFIKTDNKAKNGFNNLKNKIEKM
jgi:hypothetical protein